MITLEELDQRLSRLQKSVATVVANVFELYEHPVFRTLAGSARTGKTPVAGASREKVERACEAVSNLLLCGTEMQRVVERAVHLRAAMPLLFREEKIREIDQLLHGASIHLPATDVPLMQRGLLSEPTDGGRSLSIQQMLDAMAADFEAAKRTIFDVDRAWTTLGPRIDAADTELANLRAVSEEAGLGVTPDLLDLARRIETSREQIRLDPLGTAETVETEIGAALDQARARLSSLAAEQRQTRADLARAHQLQTELLATHTHAVAASADRRLKVAVKNGAALALPLSARQLDDACGWLAQLDAMMADPKTRHPVQIGVRRWLDTARQHLIREQNTLRADQTLLDERMELRGRLDALVAKAAGSALAEDTLLAADAQAARALLYRRPTPLEDARDLVARYNSRLHQKLSSAGH